MLEFIDSHAHYDDERFDEDREQLILSLAEKGVKNVVNIGCTLERSEKSVELAEKYPFMYAAVGIHPSDVGDTPADYLESWRSGQKIRR